MERVCFYKEKDEHVFKYVYLLFYQEIDVRALEYMYVFTFSLRIDHFKNFSVHLKELTHFHVVSLNKIFVHWQFG